MRPIVKCFGRKAFGVVILGFSLLSTLSAQTYKFAFLTTDSSSSPTALNNSGQATGFVANSGAVLWNLGPPAVTFQPLGTLNQFFGSTNPHAMNDAGQVVGTIFRFDGLFFAFEWSGGVMTSLDAQGTACVIPDGCNLILFSQASGINNAGEVVGTEFFICPPSLDQGVCPRAALWNGASITDLGTLGGTESGAAAINNAGQIVGDSTVSGTHPDHAILISGGVMTDLGTLPGDTDSSAVAINNLGQVVGVSVENGPTQQLAAHGFIWNQQSGMRDLGLLAGAVNCGPTAINDAGVVVGNCLMPDGTLRPFRWINGQMQDLAALSNLSNLPRLITVSGINNAGQIIGTSALPNGFDVATLLTPTVQAIPLLLEGLSAIPGNDDEFILTNDLNAHEAHFPLGSSFQINLWMPQPNGSRTPVPATFTLSPSATFTNALSPSPLFPSNAVFSFLPQSSSSGQLFQATHLGSQTLTIQPTDTTLSTVMVRLIVDPPQSLGSTHNNFDVGIIALADSTGMPPQMIKGQIATEGLFDPFTFRYEPLNDQVGDLAISRGDDLRTEDPYSRFRLPTIGDSFDPGNCIPFPDVNLGIPDAKCPGLTLGGSFSQHDMDVITGLGQDFHLRTWQRDPQTGQLVLNNEQRIPRRLVATDRYVSALDVFQASDAIFHFTSSAPVTRVDQLTFTGEFPLAASYGLLQMTYVTAVSELQWQGSNPPCDGVTDPLDPSGLYDTICNLQNGGGSLGLGTQKVEAAFINRFGATPNLSGLASFSNSLASAYQLYNRRKLGYGSGVVARSANFLPTSGRTIFNSGATQ